MGAPELPNDPGDDDIRSSNAINILPMPSDESDDSDEGGYDGYQPLAMEDHHLDFGHMQLDLEDRNDDDRENINRIQSNSIIIADNMAEEVANGDPSIPQIETIDSEIEREVWNLPRPLELQIELDGNKTQQILTAMASFQLPNLAIPAWAAGIPEERWKEELLQRIRQRAPSNDKSKCEIEKETN